MFRCYAYFRLVSMLILTRFYCTSITWYSLLHILSPFIEVFTYLFLNDFIIYMYIWLSCITLYYVILLWIGVARKLTQSHGNYSLWKKKREEAQALFLKESALRQAEIDTLKVCFYCIYIFMSFKCIFMSMVL